MTWALCGAVATGVDWLRVHRIEVRAPKHEQRELAVGAEYTAEDFCGGGGGGCYVDWPSIESRTS